MNNSFIARFITVLLTAAIPLNLTGCGLNDSSEPYNLYSSAIDKIAKTGGFETDCIITMTSDDYECPAFNMHIKRNGKDSQTSSGFANGETVSVITRLGNTVYMESYGYPSKFRLAPYSPADYSNLFLDGKLTNESFKGVKIVKDEDGTSSVSVHLDDSISNELMGNAMGVEQALEMQLRNIILTYIFNENKDLKAMRLTCDYVWDDPDNPSVNKIAADYTFINFGSAPEITLSQSKDEYEDEGFYGPEAVGIFDWF